MSNVKKKYDFIISLGRCCHVTDLLSKNELKIADGPWDWSGTTQEEVIYQRIRCLYKGFKHFLDKNDLVDFESYKNEFYKDWFWEAPKPIINIKFSSSKQQISKEKYIYNKRTNTYYMHDFKENIDFNSQYKVIKDKYTRRALRTLNFIKNSDSILLVYMHNLADQRRNMPLETSKVLKEMQKLRKAYPEKTIDLFMFDHDSKYTGENYYRQILDVGIIRYISNHYDVFPETDTNIRHIADGFMMPISICYILSKIELTDKHKMI